MLLTEEQLSVQEMARRFAQERLAPNSERWDREHHYPADAIAEMAQLGFFGMLVPEAWDGNDSGISRTPSRWRKSRLAMAPAPPS